MPKKITVGAIANPAFISTMQELLTKKLPVRTAWKVKTLVDKFNQELSKFTSLRREILNSHCDRDDANNPLVDEHGNYKFQEAALLKVQEELTELTSIEVEFEPVSLDELGNIDLTPQQLFNLGEVVYA